MGGKHLTGTVCPFLPAYQNGAFLKDGYKDFVRIIGYRVFQKSVIYS